MVSHFGDIPYASVTVGPPPKPRGLRGPSVSPEALKVRLSHLGLTPPVLLYLPRGAWGWGGV